MSTRSETGQRKYVNHTYRDVSRFPTEQIPDHKKSCNNFPKQLHLMLSNPELSHIITWMPHGRCWKVLDKDLLIQEGNPTYFSQNKFTSFTRQLSGWGFKRLHHPGRDKGCYYHECFLRGLPRLTELIRRAETNQGKPRPCPEGEPDFYSIARSHPLPPEGENMVVSAATSLSVPSNTFNETTRHSFSGIASEGATAVAAFASNNSFRHQPHSSVHQMDSQYSSYPGNYASILAASSENAATSETQSLGVAGRDLQVRSYQAGAQYQAQAQASTSNNSFQHQPHSSVHQMDSQHLSYPRNYASTLATSSDNAATSETRSSGVTDRDLQEVRSYQALAQYQAQAQASASNNSFQHQPHSSVHQMDSQYLSYPRNHASSLAASSGDRHAQGNAIGDNSSTNPSEEVLPQLNTRASYEQGLEQKDDDTEANHGGQSGEIHANSVRRFLERVFESQQEHGGTETDKGQEDLHTR